LNRYHPIRGLDVTSEEGIGGLVVARRGGRRLAKKDGLAPKIPCQKSQERGEAWDLVSGSGGEKKVPKSWGGEERF